MGATAFLLLCDCGGSKKARHPLFKEDLQKLSDELDITGITAAIALKQLSSFSALKVPLNFNSPNDPINSSWATQIPFAWDSKGWTGFVWLTKWVSVTKSAHASTRLTNGFRHAQLIFLGWWILQFDTGIVVATHCVKSPRTENHFAEEIKAAWTFAGMRPTSLWSI